MYNISSVICWLVCFKNVLIIKVTNDDSLLFIEREREREREKERDRNVDSVKMGFK